VEKDVTKFYTTIADGERLNSRPDWPPTPVGLLAVGTDVAAKKNISVPLAHKVSAVQPAASHCSDLIFPTPPACYISAHLIFCFDHANVTAE
jgi:hypothetical protein